MKRYSWLLLALSLVLAGATPAFAFTGRVLDERGQPIPGATVSILGRPGEAITDREGRFEWKPDPPVPFEVLVINPSGVYSKPILIESLDTSTELTITVGATVAEGVMVSGAAPGIESTPAAGTTSLSGAEVSTRLPANLIQTLENVPGVNQVSEGQAAVPAVRGLAHGRTLILIDGARITAERRVGPSATFLDPAIIDGVDVARGPGSVAYGSDAFGGVIAVRTRRVEPRSPLALRFSGSLGAGIPEQRGSVQISKGLAEGGVLFAAHAREADDWDSPEGEVLNSGYRDYGFLARVEHQAGPGVLGAGLQSDFGRDIERPRNNSETVRFFYPYEDSHRFTAGYDLLNVGGLRRVAITGFLGTYDQRTDQDRFATATTGRTVERADTSANDYGLRTVAERLMGRARVEFGVDLNGRFGLQAIDDFLTYDLSGQLVSDRPNLSIDNAHRTDTGVFASVDTAVLEWLSLGAGIRGDYVTTENTGGYFGDRSTSNGDFSGFAALTVGASIGLSSSVQVARGFRDPTLSDRYYRGPTGRGFITGNPELEPETSLQFDWTVRYAAPRYRVAAFFYNYRIDDLIERYQDGVDTFFFRNRGEARVRGFELEGQVQLGAGFSLDVATQVAEGRALDDDTYLDDISPINFTTVLRKHFANRAFAQMRVAYFSDDENFGPTERAVPGYTLLDAQGGYTIFAPLEVRVQARNLLNETYYASQDVRAVLAPGRSAALTVLVRF